MNIPLVWAWLMVVPSVHDRKHDLLYTIDRRFSLYRNNLDLANAIEEEVGSDVTSLAIASSSCRERLES